MVVTFISQCEKKALKRTRSVLDAFANRIGDNAWQTIITQEGLFAVKKLLRKTASKSTAVSCHWIRGRTRTDLLWIVGKREEFNDEGIVPVNSTAKNIGQWENNWHYLPLIRCITALAALFHDWGKATVCFQKKLKDKEYISDPLRHEWISGLLFHALVDGKNDKDWLEKVAICEIDEESILDSLEKIERPLQGLPPLATMVSWLILTHHLLPLERGECEKWSPRKLDDLNEIRQILESQYGYKNADQENRDECFKFEKGLLFNCTVWKREIKKWASKSSKQLHLLEKIGEDQGMWRIILSYARLSLMLGDHNYSSKERSEEKKWNSVKLFANTKDGKVDQRLNEHLVGVSKEAIGVVNLLPKMEKSFDYAKDIQALKRRSSKDFEWQDGAATKIKEWRDKNRQTNEEVFGFFAVNMASTGKGKTFANAKIMKALSADADGLRYVLALGLRTLTLQTGDEYKNRLEIGKEDLAVLIGSKAIKDLYDQNKENEKEQDGSESRESLLEQELKEGGIYSDCGIPEKHLKTVLRKDKHRRLLYAPILVCTIDHIMGATETIRGGKYILPYLRLMSSDLVIDEVDDFEPNDLKAIGRLIHLVGMLGKKVMISSATIPPDLAKGFFRAYCEGWQIYARSRGIKSFLGHAWIDEFKTRVRTMVPSNDNGQTFFSDQHDAFVKNRIKKLHQQKVKRKGEIVSIQDEGNSEDQYFETIKKSVITMHRRHFLTDSSTSKQVSIGIVRVANINPCIKLTKYFLETDWPNDIEIKTMAYHSRQVLLMRNEQEKHLDEVLKIREKAFENTIIKEQLLGAKRKNVIYILVATPVEEVGRDHDFDWAVIEPSSYRSFVQLAGRILRRRDIYPNEPNIALMQYNLKGYKEKIEGKEKKRKPVFCRPGYETKDCLLEDHDLKKLVDEEAIRTTIDAVPRIGYGGKLNPKKFLLDLEHETIREALNSASGLQGAGDLGGWLHQYWWMTGIPQNLYRFRDNLKREILYLIPQDDGDGDCEFMEKNSNGYFNSVEDKRNITHEDVMDKKNRLWLRRDYIGLLEGLSEEFGGDIEKCAKHYGELSLESYDRFSDKFIYYPDLGFIKG